MHSTTIPAAQYVTMSDDHQQFSHEAARKLGVPKSSLYRKLTQYGMSATEFRQGVGSSGTASSGVVTQDNSAD